MCPEQNRCLSMYQTTISGQYTEYVCTVYTNSKIITVVGGPVYRMDRFLTSGKYLTKEFGNIINSCKVSLTEKLESHKALLESKLLQEKLKLDKLDVSLPIREQIDGTAHPISQAIDEIINIFG